MKNKVKIVYGTNLMYLKKYINQISYFDDSLEIYINKKIYRKICKEVGFKIKRYMHLKIKVI